MRNVDMFTFLKGFLEAVRKRLVEAVKEGSNTF